MLYNFSVGSETFLVVVACESYTFGEPGRSLFKGVALPFLTTGTANTLTKHIFGVSDVYALLVTVLGRCGFFFPVSTRVFNAQAVIFCSHGGYPGPLIGDGC